VVRRGAINVIKDRIAAMGLAGAGAARCEAETLPLPRRKLRALRRMLERAECDRQFSHLDRSR